VISENKLKIMLDKNELLNFGLDKEDVDYSDPAVRNSFWDILDIAERKCGFKCKGEKILIQFYPAKTGGEVFITKLGLLSKSAERSLRESPRVAMLSSKLKIYKFDSLSDVVTALKITKKDLPENIRVYSSEKEEFYLIYEERREEQSYVMSEFARELPRELEPYIIERAKLLESSAFLLSS
jgi:negative regulator of genetic competence, sporulation and motility